MYWPLIGSNAIEPPQVVSLWPGDGYPRTNGDGKKLKTEQSGAAVQGL